MSEEKLKEQIRKDLEEGNPIIPGTIEEGKKIAGIIDELEEERR